MKTFKTSPAWALSLLLSGVLGILPLGARAQSGVAVALQADPLYAALGERAGLTRLVDDFMLRLLADPRTGPHFKDAGLKHLQEMLVQQFCKVSGGPCDYTGEDMQSTHRALHITRADFNALVEVLQQSMDAQGIAFRVQNQLLARLAPMHRDIVTVH